MQGIVGLLGQSDAQLFTGWGGYAGVNDHMILETLANLSQKTFLLLKVIYIIIYIYLIIIIYIYIHRKSLNRSLPQIEACLKLTPGVLQNLV